MTEWTRGHKLTAIAIGIGILTSGSWFITGLATARSDISANTTVGKTNTVAIEARETATEHLAREVNTLDKNIVKLTATIEHHAEVVGVDDRRVLPQPATFAAVESSDGTDYPLTLSEVSAQVGRHPDTVVRWLNERKVDVLKRKTRSGEYRFSHEDLAKLCEYATQVHVREEP